MSIATPTEPATSVDEIQTEILSKAAKDLERYYRTDDRTGIFDTMKKTYLAYEAASGPAHSIEDNATWGEREREERDSMAGRMLDFGLRFLDDISDGIAPTDLVIVAAKTGVGKSELMAMIGRHVTRDGEKSAFLLALEAYEGEMQRRLKWPILAKLWRAQNKGAPDLDWGKFCHGRYQDILRPYEAAAQQRLATKYPKLRTLYRTAATFGLAEMERVIVEASEHHDLTLLDHLHYVDTDSKDKNVNEYQQQKKIVAKLLELALAKRKPIIAAAHFSKPEVGKNAAILPPMEKIMGSSDISKIATQVVLLGDTGDLEPDAFPLPRNVIPRSSENPLIPTTPTFVRLAKSRIYGTARTNITAVCFFDRLAGQYHQNYVLGRLKGYGTKWVPLYEDQLQEEAPWATAACVRIKRPSTPPPKGDK